jgi:hypothetical protein
MILDFYIYKINTFTIKKHIKNAGDLNEIHGQIR